MSSLSGESKRGKKLKKSTLKLNLLKSGVISIIIVTDGKAYDGFL
jgi:hypothetical protein